MTRARNQTLGGTALTTAVAILALAACSGSDTESEPAPDPTTAATPMSRTPPAPGTVPPDWLGTRPLPIGADGYGQVQPTPDELKTRRFTMKDQLSALPGRGFAATVEAVPQQVLARSSWTSQCPVVATDLRWVRVTFWGFDNRRHTGELLINSSAADSLVSVFEQLYNDRFPIEEMRITRAAELDAAPTGDGNNTGAFTCRPLSTTSSAWSQHAYGLAIDVNPFQNPYIKDALLIPELASAYTDRLRNAPGMIRAGDRTVTAFESIGWIWGGTWRTAKDYMHFSASGY